VTCLQHSNVASNNTYKRDKLCNCLGSVTFGDTCNSMDMEEEIASTDVVSSLSKKCEICSRLGAEENKLLTEYVVKLTKDHTISSMIQEIASFANNLNNRQSDRRSGIQQSSCNVEHTDEAISQHVMFCIAPRESSVRMIICNSVLMNLLNSAKSPQDSAIAIKLLLQTQAAEKRI